MYWLWREKMTYTLVESRFICFSSTHSDSLASTHKTTFGLITAVDRFEPHMSTIHQARHPSCTLYLAEPPHPLLKHSIAIFLIQNFLCNSLSNASHFIHMKKKARLCFLLKLFKIKEKLALWRKFW